MSGFSKEDPEEADILVLLRTFLSSRASLPVSLYLNVFICKMTPTTTVVVMLVINDNVKKFLKSCFRLVTYYRLCSRQTVNAITNFILSSTAITSVSM